jgi:hypothetical protein
MNRGSGVYREIRHAVCQPDHAGKELQEQLLHLFECFRCVSGEVETPVDMSNGHFEFNAVG